MSWNPLATMYEALSEIEMLLIARSMVLLQRSEPARLKRRTSPLLVPVWTPTATIDPSLLMATALAVPLVLYCQRDRCCQITRAGMMGSDAIKTTTSSLLINATAPQMLNRQSLRPAHYTSVLYSSGDVGPA